MTKISSEVKAVVSSVINNSTLTCFNDKRKYGRRFKFYHIKNPSQQRIKKISVGLAKKGITNSCMHYTSIKGTGCGSYYTNCLVIKVFD